MHRWITLKTALRFPRRGPVSKLTPRSDHAMLRKTAKINKCYMSDSFRMLWLKFITEQFFFLKDCLLGSVARRKLLLSKKTWQQGLGLKSCIWTNLETSETMSFGQIRSKWSCMAIIQGTTFGESHTPHISRNTSYQLSSTVGWRFVLFCSHRTWTTCSHQFKHELLCISEFSRIKCEAICPAAKTWPKSGHATCQWSQAQQKIYSSMGEKENQCAAMTNQSPDLNLTDMLCCKFKTADLKNKCQQTSEKWRNVKKKSGPQSLHNDIRDWWSQKENCWLCFYQLSNHWGVYLV